MHEKNLHFLYYHNRWARGENTPSPANPKKISLPRSTTYILMFPIQLNSRRRPFYGATLQKIGCLRQPLTIFYNFALYFPLSPVRQVKFVTSWKQKKHSPLANFFWPPLPTANPTPTYDYHCCFGHPFSSCFVMEMLNIKK